MHPGIDFECELDFETLHTFSKSITAAEVLTIAPE